MAGTLEFSLLETVEVRAGDISPKVPGGLTLLVLAVLLLNAGKPVPVQRMIDLRWGEDLPGDPVHQIETCVHKLNTMFRGERLKTLITKQGSGYVIDIGSGLVDANRFRDLVKLARKAAKDGEMKLAWDLMSEALSLWSGGEPLGGLCYPNLLRDEVTPLKRLRMAAREEWCGIGLHLGQASEVLPELQRLEAEDPFNESIQDKLIRALHVKRGSYASIAAYEEFCGRLGEAMGTEPGPGLQQLRQELVGPGPIAPPDWRS